MVKEKSQLKTIMQSFLPLADEIYNKDILLRNRGFEIPELEQQIVRYFCQSSDVVEDEKQFQMLINKGAISQGSYKSDQINTLFRKSWEQEEITREPWHVPSPFMQRFIKSEIMNKAEHQQIMENYNSQKQLALQKEISVFAKGNYEKYDANESKEWVGFTQEICRAYAKKEEFELSRKFKGGSQLFFYKPVSNNDQWYIYLFFDFNNINKKNYPTLKCKNLEVMFGLIHKDRVNKSVAIDPNLKSILTFPYFFPINQVYTNYLKTFTDMRELNAIIHRYFVLYNLFATEFESCASEGVNK